MDYKYNIYKKVVLKLVVTYNFFIKLIIDLVIFIGLLKYYFIFEYMCVLYLLLYKWSANPLMYEKYNTVDQIILYLV